MAQLLAKHREQLAALCALSDMLEPLDFSQLSHLVADAPDPETAVYGVLNQVPAASAALTQKWRMIITDIWALEHPHVPLLAELVLPAAATHDAPLLHDAIAYVNALRVKPASLVAEKHEWLVHPDDVLRLAGTVPSFQRLGLSAIETEWNILPLRRLRAILHTVRLIRPLKGELVPVRSRIDRFLSLPTKHQVFILWHADVYHLDWTEYAGLWSSYLRIVQDYLPLLWEAMAPLAQDGMVASRAEFASLVLAIFSPLWAEEGLLDVRAGHTAALQIVQQHALPTIIDRFLLRDVFERHGLVRITEEFGSISKFTWTRIGEALLPAELYHQLPCGNDLLAN